MLCLFCLLFVFFFFFFSSRRRHTRLQGDWSSDVCSSDLICVLFDIGSEAPNGNGGEQHEKIDFLVMEYLEGETLSERLKKGALRSEERRVGKECRSRWSRYD